MKHLFLIIFLSLSITSHSEPLRETEWSKILSQGPIGGKTEVPTPDGMRVDILTDSIAYEVEWSSKWKESIGQSLYYGIATNRRPGIILLSGGSVKDKISYLRLMSVSGKYKILVIVVEIKDNNEYELIVDTRNKSGL